MVHGILRWLSPIIPILHVPSSLILALGTSDPVVDLAAQARWAAKLEADPQPYQDGINQATQGHVRVVEGEVITFDDPETRLPSIDRLEGFLPGGNTLYSRVLLAVRLADSRVVPAWVYAATSRRSQFTRLA